MSEDYYKFTFKSNSSRSSMEYYVLAKSMDDMNLFLKQHGFHDVYDSIQMFPKEEIKSKQLTHILHLNKFMSNRQKGVFHVMTCEDLITRAFENIANDLADHSIFGEAILRTDIEFVKLTVKYLSSLAHGVIMDFNLADESILFNTLENDNQYKNQISEMIEEYKHRIVAPTEDVGSRTILQSLYDAAPDADTGCIHPITIEGYVSTFTELMFDCYN